MTGLSSMTSACGVSREGHCRKKLTVEQSGLCSSSKEKATGSDNRAFLDLYGTILMRIERQNRGE
jgi:hypothetical protein